MQIKGAVQRYVTLQFFIAGVATDCDVGVRPSGNILIETIKNNCAATSGNNNTGIDKVTSNIQCAINV